MAKLIILIMAGTKFFAQHQHPIKTAYNLQKWVKWGTPALEEQETCYGKASIKQVC